MNNHTIRRFLKGFWALLVFPIWMILYPLLMFGASLFPVLSKSSPYRSATHYYHNTVKKNLIGEHSLRASFTFAHGLLHFLVFLIGILIMFQFYNYYKNLSVAVKTKNLSVQVLCYKPNHNNDWDNIDVEESDKLSWFRMGWNNYEGPSPIVDKDSLRDIGLFQQKGMSFRFSPHGSEKDTIIYKITIQSDFDLSIDTTQIREEHIYSENELYGAGSGLDYKIDLFGENNGKNYIVIHLMSLPQRMNSSQERYFRLRTNNIMYDESDPPYLNYFINFDFGLLLDLDNNHNQLCFANWDSISFLLDKDSKIISNYPFFNVPYELLEANPQQDSYHPYLLTYRDESFKEAMNRGVYLKYVNRDLLQKRERDTFFYTVLFGALVSFVLTVLIELLTKWRNLNLRSGNKDPYGDDE